MITSDEVAAAVGRDSVLVETSDGRQLILSRRLLSAESLYFRALFGGQFADSYSNCVKVSLSSNQLQHCLAALNAKKGGVDVSFDLEHAYEVLTPAAFLCMDRLLSILTKTIIRLVDVSCIVDMYHYALLRHPPLADGLWRLLIKNFDKVTANDDHLTLSQEEFVCALNDESLNIVNRQEMTVISKYIQAKNRRNCDLVLSLAVNMRYNGDGAVAPVVRNRIPSEVVMVVGGWCTNGPTALVETFNPRNHRWVRSPQLNNLSRAYHSLSFVDGKMIIAGGMDGRAFFNTANSLDLNTMEWTTLPEMSERRCYLSSVVIPESNGAKRVFVGGGYNGMERSSTCEMLTVDNWSWTSLKSMYRRRSDAAAVLLDGSIAVVGGFDGRDVHQDVEMFDLNTGSWSSLNRRMRVCRTGVSAVSLNDNVLIVVGGFNGTTRLASAEMYDTREGLWHAMPRMVTTRSNFCLEHMNGYIYAVGGFDGQSTSAASERYDIVAQRWETLPNMSIARSALRAVRVEEPHFVRRLIHFDEDF